MTDLAAVDRVVAVVKAAAVRLNRREATLSPLRASTTTAVAALGRHVQTGALTAAAFVPAGVGVLRDAYTDAYRAGSVDAASDFEEASAEDEWDDEATARAQTQAPYLSSFAVAITDGMSPAELNARAALYGETVTPAYEEAYTTTASVSGHAITYRWHATGDDHTCENCASLDGEEFTATNLPGWPGDGGFGGLELCVAGPNCRCWLEVIDHGEAVAETDRPSTARQEGLAALGTSKDFAVGAPLASGFVPFDLAGPGRRRRRKKGARWHNSDGSSPDATEELLQNHLLADHHPRVHYSDLPAGGRSAMDRFHAEQHAEHGDSAHGATKSAPSLPARPAHHMDTTPIAAGIALRAGDTGRVLMQQRALGDDDGRDLNAGKWELPGGHVDPEDPSPWAAAVREFQEETGMGLPDDARVVTTWTSPDGSTYLGFVVETATEAAVPINGDGAAREFTNPDGDLFEVAAWHDPDEIPGNPAMRPEVAQMDWRALLTPAPPAQDGGKVPKGTVHYREATDPARSCGTCSMFMARAGLCSLVAGPIRPEDTCDRWEPAPFTTVKRGRVDPDPHKAATRHVMKYLRKNYDKADLDWVKGCDWQLDMAVPLTRIAMAHRPGGRDPADVAEKVEKIKAGKQPKPIVVVNGGGRKLIIADGYNRTEALKKAGHETTAAWIGTPSPTDTDWPQKVRQMQYNVENHDVPREDDREESNQ